MLYSFIRPLLFQLDAEKAHELTLNLLDKLPPFLFKKLPETQPITAMGLTFPHQVGLAAGLDKNGDHLNGLAKLGFSHIEIGTVTPLPQSGNGKPRLFRLKEAKALINRMGFNNHGVDYLVKNLKNSTYKGLLGINIGKNKNTSLNEAVNDYMHCLKKVYEYASYITINISSPNTPDLRQLQQAEYLNNLLSILNEERQALSDRHQRQVPLVVKLSPDENQETIKQMAEIILANQIDGIIATNTTCSRNGVKHLALSKEIGGLSGQPLFAPSTQTLILLRELVGESFTLIGVGGIDSIESAKTKLKAGADLLQLYTGLIYQGPSLISHLVHKI